MAGRARKTIEALVPGLLVVASLGCGGGGGGSGSPAADSLSANMQWGVPATAVDGQLPSGSATGPQVVPLPTTGSPMVVAPGQAINVPVAWSGGQISGTNVAFGQGGASSKYFNIPVPAAGTHTSGSAMIPGTIGPNACKGLDAICHQIECYEQVRFPDGQSTSKAQAIRMVLNCGNGTCGIANNCNQQQQAGGDAGETHTVELGRPAGSFTFNWDMYTKPDRMTVTYEGRTLLDTGCVSGPGSRTLPFSGHATTITVQVFPNCQGGSAGTQWIYEVQCPN